MNTQVTYHGSFGKRWTYFNGTAHEQATMAVDSAKAEGLKGPFTVWVYLAKGKVRCVNTLRDTPDLEYTEGEKAVSGI